MIVYWHWDQIEVNQHEYQHNLYLDSEAQKSTQKVPAQFPNADQR